MVKYFTLSSLAFILFLSLLDLSFVPKYSPDRSSDRNVAQFGYKKISVPTPPPLSSVLGNSTEAKRIEVDLTAQRVYAYEGGRQVFNFLISSGKWDRTPTGTFKIWAKVRSQKMEGGSKTLGTYYYLPKVPYIMFFYNDKVKKHVGYSLHGTYWHSNFGVPMSHGCVNMKTPEAALLYPWVEVDTPVIIYGKYRRS